MRAVATMIGRSLHEVFDAYFNPWLWHRYRKGIGHYGDVLTIFANVFWARIKVSGIKRPLRFPIPYFCLFPATVEVGRNSRRVLVHCPRWILGTSIRSSTGSSAF